MAEIDLRSADQTINKQIPNGLPGEAMRKSMENKNILAEKGSLYVGTGKTEVVSIDGTGDSYIIAQTDKITPTVDGTVLVADSTSSTGLSYKNVNSLISGVVRYDISQEDLTGANQAQARTNIHAAKEFEVGSGLDLTTSSSNDIIYLKAATESELGGIKVSVVQSLPTTLVDDVFYFVTT